MITEAALIEILTQCGIAASKQAAASIVTAIAAYEIKKKEKCKKKQSKK
jgi:hypothetical protein